MGAFEKYVENHEKAHNQMVPFEERVIAALDSDEALGAVRRRLEAFVEGWLTQYADMLQEAKRSSEDGFKQYVDEFVQRIYPTYAGKPSYETVLLLDDLRILLEAVKRGKIVYDR